MVQRSSKSFLVDSFEEFYREVIRLKRKVEGGEWMFVDDSAADVAPGAEEEDTPGAIWKVLLALLERQSLTARRMGGDLAVQLYRQAQYVMAAMADEVFIHMDWAGRSSWKSNLLESRLFNSHRAGAVMFERIDDLFESRDPVNPDLVELYLMALALGFEGKYRGVENGALELASYRQRLYELLAGGVPKVLGGEERLCPQAYLNVLDQESGRQLPYLKGWVLAFVALLGIWLLAGHFIWRGLIANMEAIIATYAY